MINRLSIKMFAGSWVPVTLIAIGIGLRLVWVATNTTATQMIGEANNVAISFARNGTLADAFRPGQGPTAHIMPLTPIIAGSVYRLFGVQTISANFLLTCFALSLLVVTWSSLYNCMALTSMSRHARLGALAVLTLAPINFAIEAVEFRVWEGGLAVALSSTLLWHVLLLDAVENPSVKRILLLSLHAAITLFVSPALGLSAFACGGLLMIRRSAKARWPTVILGVFAITILVLTPWTIRNVIVMNRPIVLRDNFGLEFAQAYYEGAEVPGNPRAKFLARHRAIHPYQPIGNALMVAVGGEVRYSDMLGLEAQSWVKRHPKDAFDVALHHLRDFLFPPTWYWSQFGRTGAATSAKQAVNWALSFFALIGLVYGMIFLRGRFYYVMLMILLPIFPYLFVEPTLRYRYLITNLLAFVAVWCFSCIAGKIYDRLYSVTEASSSGVR